MAANSFLTEVKEVTGTATVDGTDDTILEITPLVDAYTEMCFTVANASASQALSAFKMQVKTHSGGDYKTILESTGWDAAGGALLSFKETLKTLGTSTTGFAHVRFGPVYAVKFLGSVAATSAAITIKGRLFR